MKHWLIISTILFLGVNLLAQNEKLDQKISAHIADSAFDYASVGISVREIDGDEVISYNSNRKLIPASSLKLITTLSALEILGEKQQLKTKIGYTGTIDESGTLNGNIVVIGSGDPTLGSSRFSNPYEDVIQSITDKIKSAGIKCIEGTIEIRTNIFSGQPVPGSWPSEDVANYYGSGAWALNIRENEYDLFFKAKTKKGNLARIDNVFPYIPYLKISSEVITEDANSGDNAYIYGDQYHYQKIVRGTIPYTSKPFKIRGSIPNPPLTFAAIISETLESNGIYANGINISKEPIKKSDFKEILRFTSPPISDIVKQANYESINLYCESLLKLIAKKETGIGSTENGVNLVLDKLKSLGLDEHTISMKDGSGLSPRNLITPRTFTLFLAKKFKDLGKDTILKYIPQTGVSGTVASLLDKKKSQKKYYLKSGSMGGVLSYTGYFRSKSDKWYTICFISNNHSRGNKKVKIEAEKIFETLYLNL